MKEVDKTDFGCLLLVIIFIICSFAMLKLASTPVLKTYEVEIVYCDSRLPEKIIVKLEYPPTNNDIAVYKQGAPVWGYAGRSYVNVCELNSAEK